MNIDVVEVASRTTAVDLELREEADEFDLLECGLLLLLLLRVSSSSSPL